MKHLMYLVLFLIFSTNSFAQKLKENIFNNIPISESTNQKTKVINPLTDISTITIINNSNGLIRELLVKLKSDENTLYRIIDMNAKSNQDNLNANIYFVLANLGYNVPEIEDKCWSTIRLRGVNYIALFVDITKIYKK